MNTRGRSSYSSKNKDLSALVWHLTEIRSDRMLHSFYVAGLMACKQDRQISFTLEASLSRVEYEAELGSKTPTFESSRNEIIFRVKLSNTMFSSGKSFFFVLSLLVTGSMLV